VNTLYKSLSRRDLCSQALPPVRCLVSSSNGGRSSAPGLTSLQAGGHLRSSQAIVKFKVMLRPTVDRPACLGVKPHGQDHIFVTVRKLSVCSCGASSLTRGRVCRLSSQGQSHSSYEYTTVGLPPISSCGSQVP
jgi:hypothetical protein